MSLAIDIDAVVAVLLPDGVWHAVADQSFDLDSYEMVWEHQPVLRGGQDKPAVPATGFTFRQAGVGWLYGPLTSVLAVRTNSGPQEEPDQPTPRARVTSPDRGDR